MGGPVRTLFPLSAGLSLIDEAWLSSASVIKVFLAETNYWRGTTLNLLQANNIDGDLAHRQTMTS